MTKDSCRGAQPRAHAGTPAPDGYPAQPL